MLSYDEAKTEKDVFWRWEKMSKSKGNVVTPEEAAEKYGADALRIYELFEAPFEQTIQWSEERVQGPIRFLNRVFKLCEDSCSFLIKDWREKIDDQSFDKSQKDLRYATHFAIDKLSRDIDDFSFNTSIAALMEFTNSISDFMKASDISFEPNALVLSEAVESLVLLLAPIAPHSADEMWSSLGYQGFTALHPWPKADAALLVRDQVTIALQVNGKLRGTIEVPADISKEDLENQALAHEKVRQFTEGQAIRKVVVVPGKLVNVVAA